MTQLVATYSYRTKPGVSEDAYLAAAETPHARLAAAPGFQYRCLARTEEGWLETIFWESAKAADAANETFMAAMAGSEWLGMIDTESLEVHRYPVMQAGGPAPAAASVAAGA